MKEVFDIVKQAFESKQQTIKKIKIDQELDNEILDYDTPGHKIEIGHYTLLTKMRRQVEEIFQGLGFRIAYGDHVVSKYDNFYSVNIPADHPATEMHDTIYLKQTDETGEPLLLRTHTSAMQNKLIKKYGVPLKVVVPSKVYRYENTDASHDTMFRQIEGLVIDE